MHESLDALGLFRQSLHRQSTNKGVGLSPGNDGVPLRLQMRDVLIALASQPSSGPRGYLTAALWFAMCNARFSSDLFAQAALRILLKFLM